MEHFGDAAMDNRRHEEALVYYSAALSIQPANTRDFFIVRSKVATAKGSWEDAVDDANEVSSVISPQILMSTRNHQAIAFDPSSPRGYATKRAALHQAGRYDDAIQTSEMMLSKMAQSPDPKIRGELCPHRTSQG